MTDRRRLALVGVLALVYAVCYSAIKAGLEAAPPLRFGGLRALGGGVALLGYVALTRRDGIVPPRPTWIGVAALAFLGTFVLYGAMFLSPSVVGAGISSVLGNTGPLFAVAVAGAVLGEPVTKRKVFALAAGFGGVVLVAYPSVTGSTARAALSALIPLTAAAAAAGSAVLLKWLEVGDALLAVVAWQLLLGGAGLLALSALVEPAPSAFWPAWFVADLAFLALVGTAFAVAAWYWLVQREDIGRLSILLMVLVPVLGLGLARIVFDEPIGLVAAIGALLALVGIGVAAGGAPGGRVVQSGRASSASAITT